MTPASDWPRQLSSPQGALISIEVRGDLEILMSRIFDAPPALVFAAHTEPEHLKNWWGRRGSILTVCEVDLRPGGKWRFVSLDADGNEYAFNGEFREIDPPHRLVQTFIFEPMPEMMAVDHYSFEDIGNGQTKLTTVSVFDSKEGRDGLLGNGMEEGATEIWDRLAELLVTIK